MKTTTFTISPGVELYLGETPPSHFIPEVDRIEWITALRSGKFKQDIRRLKTQDGYCCLGVKMEIEGCEWKFHNDIVACYIANDVYSTYLGKNSFSISSLGDFPEGTRVIIGNNLCAKTLAGCNDERVSFDDIAKIIDIVWNPATWREESPS